MICGIGGWVDGGEAATGSVQYLVRKLEAKKFADMPIEKFHVFQTPGQLSLRPSIVIEDGLLKEHRFPQNQFFYWLNSKAENDLILFLGTEPNLNWGDYAHTILDMAEEFSVVRTYLLGGVLDKTPHTREPGLSCTCSSEKVKEEMLKHAVQFGNYEGPGSFSATLLHLYQGKEEGMVSLTARATYYPEFDIIIPRNPKTIRAIIRRLSHLCHFDLDASDLDKQAEEFEAKLNFMASQNPRFQTYVEELEKEYTEVKYEEPLEMSADEAVRLAEEFLKGERED